MKSKEELMKTLASNSALLEKLEASWKSQSSDDEIKKILSEADADLSVEDVQELLAICQQEKLVDLKNALLDDAQLEIVAGGGNGLCEGSGNCDDAFKIHTSIPRKERCHIAWLCDELNNHDCFNSFANIEKPDDYYDKFGRDRS